jgi:hypothetical protein
MKRQYFCPILHLNESFALNDQEYSVVIGQFLTSILELFEQDLLQKINLYICGRGLKLAGTKHKALVNQIKRKFDEGCIEFMGGGFYDPVFPLIPKLSQNLQIQLHKDELKTWFEATPQGIWLPSFVWESSMISMISENNFEYTVLKDYQLEGALWRYPTSKGYWAMEDQGHLVKFISSSSKAFQYFRENKIEELCVEIQNELDAQNEGALWYTLDIPFLRHQRGQYEHHWFENFKELLVQLQAKGFVQKLLASQIHEQECGGNIHIPSSVGRSLGLEVGLNSIRDLLLLQPECNLIQKKVQKLFQKIQKINSEKAKHLLHSDLLICQSIYWLRNQFATGGLVHLQDRLQIFKNILASEKSWRAHAEHDGVSFEESDLLGRGHSQIQLANNDLNILIEQRDGGRIRSLEFIPTLSQLVSGYNPPTKKQLQKPYFSVIPECGSKDHFFETDKFSANFMRDDSDLSETVIQIPYDYSLRTTSDSIQATLIGTLGLNVDQTAHLLRSEKVFSLPAKKREMTLVQQITNSTFQRLMGVWATEWILTPGDFEFHSTRIRVNHQKLDNIRISGQFDVVEHLEVIDPVGKMTIQFQFIKPCKLLYLPIWQNLGNNGEPIFQGLRLFFGWNLDLMSQDKFSCTFKVKFRKMWGFL